MFDKMFEAIARNRLQENAIGRLSEKLSDRHYRKIGAIVKLPNGTDGLDMVKVSASNLKRNVLFSVVTIGAAIAAGKLGSMNH